MKVEIDVVPAPRFPPLCGPHELAWGYLLDTIFADAFHAGLETVRFILPGAALTDRVRLRGELTNAPARAGTKGLVLLCSAPLLARSAERIYTLDYGPLAPRALRAAGTSMAGPEWTLERRVSIFTWKVMAWGVVIRCATMLRRLAVVDRAMFAMRRSFCSEGKVPSYYALSVWQRR